MAATTALYPVVIQQSFDRYTEGRHDWLWLVPIVIILVTSLKAAAQFGQAVAIQAVVLRVIEGLQNGRVAFYSKAHHSGIDGKAGVEMAKVLYDISPATREVSPRRYLWPACWRSRWTRILRESCVPGRPCRFRSGLRPGS